MITVFQCLLFGDTGDHDRVRFTEVLRKHRLALQADSQRMPRRLGHCEHLPESLSVGI